MQRVFFKYCLYLGLSTLLFMSCRRAEPKSPPFWDEIQRYKIADSLNPPPENITLFVGGSSFRLWTDLEREFDDYQALNRGFGGATLLDLIRYSPDIIFPYKPRQIIIYCGENDLPSDSVDVDLLYKRFQNFYKQLRSRMPNVPVAYISLKPSQARAKYIPIIVAYNAKMKAFAAREPNFEFINILPLLLSKELRLRPELYQDDQLHMNEEGYKIWKKAISPYLIKISAK